MAGVLLHATSGEVTLAAATAKTTLQLKAAANQRVLVSAISLLGKAAAGGTDTPVKARITRSTTAFGTAGTGANAAVVSKNDPSDSEAIQTTAGGNFTAEPTSADAGIWYEFNPQSGLVIQFAPGKEWKIPGGQSLQIELTSVATPTIVTDMDFEE